MIQLSGSNNPPQLMMLLYSVFFVLSSIFIKLRMIYAKKVRCRSGRSACYEFVKVQENYCFTPSRMRTYR